MLNANPHAVNEEDSDSDGPPPLQDSSDDEPVPSLHPSMPGLVSSDDDNSDGADDVREFFDRLTNTRIGMALGVPPRGVL